MRYLLLSLSLVFLAVFANAQSFIKVEVLSGSSTTTCTDANSEPENLWGVNIEGEGYDYYAPSGFCELNTLFILFFIRKVFYLPDKRGVVRQHLLAVEFLFGQRVPSSSTLIRFRNARPSDRHTYPCVLLTT